MQNSSTPIKPENKIDVRAKLAKTANVSTDTYSKGKKILDSDNEEVKEKYNSTVGRPSKNNCSPNGEQSKNKLHTDKELAKLADVMQWMISHQQARRNLSPGELIFANSMVAEEIAEENREKISKAVSESNRNRSSNCVQMDAHENKPRDRSTNTREQVAKLSGVGTGTVARYDAVMKEK